jgi:hypothetical protein
MASGDHGGFEGTTYTQAMLYWFAVAGGITPGSGATRAATAYATSGRELTERARAHGVWQPHEAISVGQIARFRYSVDGMAESP